VTLHSLEKPVTSLSGRRTRSALNAGWLKPPNATDSNLQQTGS